MDWPASASAHHHHHTTAAPDRSSVGVARTAASVDGPHHAAHPSRAWVSSKAASEQPVMNGCERAVIGHWLHGLCGHRMRAHHRGAVPTVDARDGFRIAPSASTSAFVAPSPFKQWAGSVRALALHGFARRSEAEPVDEQDGCSGGGCAAQRVGNLRGGRQLASQRIEGARPELGCSCMGQGSQHWSIDKPASHLHATNIHDDEALVHCGSDQLGIVRRKRPSPSCRQPTMEVDGERG